MIVPVPLMANPLVTETPSKASVGALRMAPVHFVTTLTGHREGCPCKLRNCFSLGFEFGFEGFRSPQGQARRPI